MYALRTRMQSLGCILLLLLLKPFAVTAQSPHACDGSFFISKQTAGEGSSQLFRIQPANLERTDKWELITTFQGRKIGPIGFRVVDNLVYVLDTETLDLLMVDAAGEIRLRGNLTSQLDTTLTYHAGAITPFGKYFILIGRNPITGYDDQLDRKSVV